MLKEQSFSFEKTKKIIFILFLLSGASSLMYQIIWSKILLYIFGNSVYSATAVVASFMLGLCLGSYFIGKAADRIKRHIMAYGILELFVALFSFATYFILYKHINSIYKIFYLSPDEPMLLVKFIISSTIILIPAFLMGGTFPIILKYLSPSASIQSITSRLYGINTLGAVIGVAAAGFFLLELVGLKATLFIALTLNILIAVAAVVLEKYKPALGEKNKGQTNEKRVDSHFSFEPVNNFKKIIYLLFALSGFLSLSYEIIWMRLFVPMIGNFTYSFSFILVIFLTGIATGSFFVNKLQLKKPLMVIAFCQVVIGLGSFVILLIINNFAFIQLLVLPVFTLLFLTTFLMGVIFPLIYAVSFVGEKEKKVGEKSGLLYSINTIGAVAGVTFTGLFLLGLIGGSKAAAWYAFANIIIALFFIMLDKKWQENKKSVWLFRAALVSGFIIAALAITNNPLLESLISKKIKSSLPPDQYFITQDAEAEIIAFSGEIGTHLLINGIGMTHLTIDTKMMAHLPVFLHDNPREILVIALGMGTTYRSALKYDMKVDAVELIPSVPHTLPIFHQDADKFLKDPKGKIYINDGYNYASLTEKKYDIITVDPPPPVNSAGTTVLYSREFFEANKKIMNEDGIFLLWLYSHMLEEEALVIINTFARSFPYTQTWASIEKNGIYLIGSFKELTPSYKRFMDYYSNQAVYNDINEWQEKKVSLDEIYRLKFDSQKLLNAASERPIVTNDRPIVEYYLWRELMNKNNNIFTAQLEYYQNSKDEKNWQ